MKKFLVPIIIILIVLGIAQVLYSQKGISSKEAGKIVIDYVNKVLEGQATAILVGDVVKENGVYKLNLKIGEQDMISYISLDGELIFPSGIAITEDTTVNGDANSDIPKQDKTKADLFVMSFCPYGNQAEEIIIPVVNLLGDKVDIELHYVIYENYQGGGSDYCVAESKYCSMHGIQELNQDVRELCVQKYQKEKFWGFVKQINTSCNYQDVDACWENVAKSSGVDVNNVKTCFAEEKISLLENEVELGKKYDISGSPQLIINDKEFTGTRSAEGYKSAICAGFNTAPSECSTSLGNSPDTTAAGECE
ncbi:MAG TPA: thioredoxin domain-containing protein [Candidatus Paceibacterota bacterium]|nr:thioredoxin domain-containing protein [Candidatus Paceibacterota bacterium]